MLTSAWVSRGRALAAYSIKEDGTARFVGEFSMLPADIPEGRCVAVGEILGLEVNGRVFPVVLDTCDHCHAPVEGGVRGAGGERFCNDDCREEWRLNH